MSSFDEQQLLAERAGPPKITVQPVGRGEGAGLGGIQSFLDVMRRRILIAAATFVVVMTIALAYILTRQPLFESHTLIDLNPNGTNGANLSDALGQRLGFQEANSQTATQVEILKSSELALNVCEEQGLLKDPTFIKLLGPSTQPIPANTSCLTLDPHNRLRVVGVLQQLIHVDSVAPTNLVRIQVTSVNRRLSLIVAEGVVNAFITENLRAGVAGTDRVSEWLENQMQLLREQVNDTQKSLADYQRDKNIVSSDTNGGQAVEELGLLQTQLASASADRIQKEALLKVAESSSPELISSIADADNIQVLRNQKVQLQAEYDQLTTKFGPDYPRVKELAGQIAASQRALDREVSTVRKKLQNDYTAAVDVENALKASYAKKEQEAFQLNDSAARYAILRQNAESARDLYNAIEYKLRESGIEETLKSAEIRVIEPAVLADLPIYPRKTRMGVYALLVALFASVGIAYLLNYLDDSFHSPDLIEQLTGLPVLATVPHIEGSGKTALEGNRGTLSPSLVSAVQPMSLPTEAYRALRSSVLLSRGDRSIAVQLLTSGSQSEGKSLTACNYAVTLAQQGLRVLLVDADLRRGSIHAYFGLPRSPGMSELLSTGQATGNFVHSIKEVPGLDVLTIGLTPPNPSELLNSQRFNDLVDTWRKQYDFVVIDSAPVLPVADSYGIATKADVVLLVVRIEQTRTRGLVRTEEILRRLGARVLGVVVNDITSRSQGYRYHYYGDYKYEAREDKK